MAIDKKVQGSRIAVTHGSHGMVEFDDHKRIEELAWSHKRLQGITLHKSHRVSKLREGCESQNVIEILIV